MNRSERRAMRRKAPATAAIMAACCFDFEKGGTRPVTEPKAISALTRAFTLLLKSGGQSLAIPLSEAEALGFPERKADHLPGAVNWLAVGLDKEGRASYALHSAKSENRAQAHEAARALALNRLKGICATAGFPPFRGPEKAGGAR